MKKEFFNFKRLIIKGGFIMSTLVMALSFSSCSDAKKEDTTREGTKEVAEDKNDAKFDNNKKESDADFLVAAAEINLEEIQLGQLAQQKSKMGEVKEMGKMLVTDHSKALKELQGLAAKKQISLPTALTDKGKDAYKKLSDKTGKDFDKDYCDMMVDGHKDAIDKFEKAAAGAADADVKTWAAAMLPGLRAHLDHATACKKNCEKM